ncbi:hypothetical protein L484_026697 [Morus notabilis]|uniref:Uncharacterized protein n=1 Tax=Morus notabilis TaxID=981085 RepID=W9SN18_9ROSA|nr:uncharacterized protein LOC21409342 [Morus notabilis]EXC35372.1 hypothetical protein L484_026697 [Morus notabilis]
MAAGEDVDLSTLKSQLCQTHEIWKQEMEQRQSQVDVLQAKLIEVKACIEESEEESKKELEVLWRRVKTTATLLTYLKSKARLMAVPHLAHTSCGIKQLEGIGLVDKNGAPLSAWSKNVDLSSFDGPDEEIWIEIKKQHGSLDEQDVAYIGEILKSVQMVTDVMEVLVKRVLLAESETAVEKENVSLSQEEIKKKSVQIENMSVKLEEMEMFALGTNSILNEMRQRVDDLVEETSRQRQRAAENEQELSRVKREFESLKSYVSSLITVRETLLSSEKQFQTIERLFERLVAKTTQLEGEKMQKEAEVQKLMEENVRLTALLDKKEAQLLAMNEQCKVMALNASNI